MVAVGQHVVVFSLVDVLVHLGVVFSHGAAVLGNSHVVDMDVDVFSKV